jgi:TetR/AcrR family transcriptional regulator, transcriptional repressor for nem operon
MGDTREYITDKAFELFLTRSYEAVSIRDISQAIGLTKGALYHHFINKEELFKAVIDKYLVFTGPEGDLDNTSLQRYNELVVSNVKKMMDKLFSKNTKFIPINYLTLIADGFKHYPGFAAEKESFFNAEISKTKRVLDNAIKRGEIRSDINTSAVAMTYFSVAIGLAGNMLQNYSVKESINSLKEQLDELLKLLSA